MQIEYITRISLTARRTLQQKRQRTVSNRMFGQIIVNDQHVLALIHEKLCHSCTGIGCDILQRRRLAGGSGYQDGIVHGSVFCKCIHDFGDRRGLLTDSHVYTDHILTLLVDDRICGNGCLTGLTVTDDQLTLSAADGEHGINGQNTGLQRYGNGFTGSNARCFMLDGTIFLDVKITFTVNGLTQSVDYTSQKLLRYRNPRLTACTGNTCSRLDTLIRAEKNTADTVMADILYQTLDTGIKDNNLTIHGMTHAVNSSNTVTDTDNGTVFLVVSFKIKMGDLFLKYRDDLFRIVIRRQTSGLFAHGVLKLLHTAIQTPVEYLIFYLQLETTDQGLIFNNLDLCLFTVIFCNNKLPDLFQLFLFRFIDTGQCSFDDLISLISEPEKLITDGTDVTDTSLLCQIRKKNAKFLWKQSINDALFFLQRYRRIHQGCLHQRVIHKYLTHFLHHTLRYGQIAESAGEITRFLHCQHLLLLL